MNRNLAYFKWYRILFLTMMIDPVYVLYACSAGLSATEIFVLAGMESVLIILLEIPTGIISDLFGYKASMVLAAGCFILSNLVIVAAPVFWGFAAATVLTALYKVFASGADEAYLYLILDDKSSYTETAGMLGSITFIMTGAASVSAGFLYAADRRAPFLLSAGVCSLALCMALKLENVKEPHQEIRSAGELWRGLGTGAKKGFRLVFQSKKLRWFTACSAVISFVLVALLQSYQIFLTERQIPVAWFGILYFVLYAVSAVSSKAAPYFKRFQAQKLFLAFLLLLVLTPLLMMVPVRAGIVFLAIPRIIIGIYPAVMNEYMNKEIKTERATVFSIRSLLSKIPQVALLPYVGNLIDRRGLNGFLAVMAAVTAVAVAVLGSMAGKEGRHRGMEGE